MVAVPAPALDDFLARIDPALAPGVRTLHEAVMASGTSFDAAVKYQMLSYAQGGDFRHWVCAVDVGRSGFKSYQGAAPAKRALHVRFLYGVLLDDPQDLLRAGSSILKTLDFASPEEVDGPLVTAFVKDAVARFDEFKASEYWVR